jgi:hypothetical protein
MNASYDEAFERAIKWIEVGSAGSLPKPYHKPNGMRLLAMGDSWFHYPFALDVLQSLESDRFTIDSMAGTTATLDDMAPPANWDPNAPNQPAASGGGQLNKLIQTVQQLSDAQINDVRAILISAGGDDIVLPKGRLASLLNAYGSNLPALKEEALKKIVDQDLGAALMRALAAATAVSHYFLGRKVPILIHGYGYPVPDGRFTGVPPLWSVINQQMGYKNLQVGTEIMKTLIDRFNKMQIQLLAAHRRVFAHVIHVDVRNKLSNTVEGSTWQDDWCNELHPTNTGFDKVGHAFAVALNGQSQ